MAWHVCMNTELARVQGDRKLYALAQKQRDFIKLLEERAAILKRWTRYRDAMSAADEACDGQFMPLNDRFLRPWERIWNPYDRVGGWDLLRLYDRDAFLDIAVQAPSELHAQLALGDYGVFSSPALEYGMNAFEVNATMAVLQGDPLAAVQYTTLAGLGPDQLAEVDEPAAIIEPVEPPPGPRQCPAYTALDGLPSVGNDLGCSGFIMLTSCSDGARYQVTMALREIDARIEQALMEVEPY